MLGRKIAVVVFVVTACMTASFAHAQIKADDGVPVAATADGAPTESGQSPAGNADAAARDRAKQLYEQGQLAYRQGRYSEAIDKLLEADRAMPNAAFSYNIALVYEKMGDQRSALRWLRSYLRQSGKVNDEATQAKVRKFEGELQARGLQQVSILSTPPGATLQVDGHALGLTPFTTELTPGMHRFALTLPGHTPVQKDFELRSDRSLDIEVTLEVQAAESVSSSQSAHPGWSVQKAPGEALGDVKPLASTIVAPSPKPERQGTTSSPHPHSPTPRIGIWTWIGLGAGVAFLGGGVALEFERRRLEGRAQSAAQADYQARFDRMETAKTVARVFTGIGTAAMLTGASLLAIDLVQSNKKRSATLTGCASMGPCVEVRGQF